MLRLRARSFLRLASLLAASWLVVFGSTASASTDCDRFTPFGQPVHRSLADDVGASAPPDWTVICHAGQVVAFNAERKRLRLGGPPPSTRRPPQ